MYTSISKVIQLSWSIRQQTLEASLEYTRQWQEYMSCVIKFLESKKNIKKAKHSYFFLTYKKVSALVTTSYSNNWVKIINLIWHRKFTLLQSSFSANKLMVKRENSNKSYKTHKNKKGRENWPHGYRKVEKQRWQRPSQGRGHWSYQSKRSQAQTEPLQEQQRKVAKMISSAGPTQKRPSLHPQPKPHHQLLHHHWRSFWQRLQWKYEAWIWTWRNSKGVMKAWGEWGLS